MKTAFLDRDGTINVRAASHAYVRTWEEFVYLPGAEEAIRRLKTDGWRVIVITNQRGIARGLIRQTDVDAIHARICSDLGVDRVYVCPHDVGACTCRKPSTEFFLRARNDFPDIDFREAVVIGDADDDKEAAQAIGCASVRVGPPPLPSLLDAVRGIVDPTGTWRAWAGAVAISIASVSDDILRQAAEIVLDAQVVLCAGNGGSSAIASHATQAIAKPDYQAGGGRAAVTITDNIPTLTAHANDGGWVDALVEIARPWIDTVPKCSLLAISSSGKSENVVRLAKLVRERGLSVIAFTGFDGGPLRDLATVSIHVDSTDYEVVEPAHDALLHRVQYHLRLLARAQR